MIIFIDGTLSEYNFISAGVRITIIFIKNNKNTLEKLFSDTIKVRVMNNVYIFADIGEFMQEKLFCDAKIHQYGKSV